MAGECFLSFWSTAWIPLLFLHSPVLQETETRFSRCIWLLPPHACSLRPRPTEWEIGFCKADPTPCGRDTGGFGRAWPWGTAAPLGGSLSR